jgi:hypothetical protein
LSNFGDFISLQKNHYKECVDMRALRLGFFWIVELRAVATYRFVNWLKRRAGLV